MYASIRIYADICGYMWIYVDICGYMHILKNKIIYSVNIHACKSMRIYADICNFFLDICGYMQKHKITLGYMQIYADICKFAYISKYPHISVFCGYMWIYAKMHISKIVRLAHIRIYLK